MGIIVTSQHRTESSKGIRSENVLHGKTVVFVDDSEIQRNRLKDLYVSLGMVCIGEAENGLDALHMTESLKPDLVSLDILMAVMHGIETLGYMRRSKSSAFVVFVSALPGLESTPDMKFNGHSPDAIFSKKDNRETFLQILAELFSAEPTGFHTPHFVNENTA